MKQDTVIVREIYQHRLEDALSKGKVLLICFDDGEIKYVTKYKEERHYIQFEDGEIRDLYVILNNIQYYKLAVDKNDEPKKNTANKSTTKKQATKKIFSIYSLAKGKPGKKYTIKQFLDINLTAYFTAQTNGIDDIEKQDVLISTTNKSIVINMSQSQKVGIYNIQGQIVYEGQEKNLTLPIKAGVYLVKINGMRGKTVVVF